MKLSKILLASSLVVFGLTGCALDKTSIIKVNDEVVTKGQYEQAFNKEIKGPQYAQFADVLKADEENIMTLMIKERVVNELILKTILNQEVKKRDITVSKEDIEKRRAEIIEKLGSEERLNDLLKKNGRSNKDFAQDIEDELKVDKLIEATGKSKVSDNEIKDFYNKNKANWNYPERVRASHILVEVNPAAIKQDIINKDKSGKLSNDDINKKVQEEVDKKMALAKEIRAKAVKDPKNFANLAKQYSDDKGSAAMGGDLGFFSKDDMVKPFSDAAFGLKPGTISEIVVSDYGNHIIIVTDKAKAGMQPFDKMKDEIRVYLEQKKKIDILKNLLDGLKATAKVEFTDESFSPKEIQKKILEENKKQEEQFKEIQQEAIKKGEITPPKK